MSAERILSGLFDAYESIARGEREPAANPLAVLLAASATAAAAAFSASPLAAAAALLSAAAQAALLRVDARRVAKPLAAATALALAISLPLLAGAAWGVGGALVKWAGPPRVAAFVLRVAASSLALLAAAAHLGWWGLVAALAGLRLPSFFTLSLALMLRYVPLLTREAARMVLAREARRLSSGLGPTWLLLSTVVGDLVARSVRRAAALGMAMEARGGAPRAPVAQRGIGLREAALIASAAPPLALLCLAR